MNKSTQRLLGGTFFRIQYATHLALFRLFSSTENPKSDLCVNGKSKPRTGRQRETVIQIRRHAKKTHNRHTDKVNEGVCRKTLGCTFWFLFFFCFSVFSLSYLLVKGKITKNKKSL